MQRIIIDMDHVMADITSHYLNWYKQHTGVSIDPETLIGKNEVAAFPDSELVRSFLYKPGFFRTPPVMPGSQEVIARLNEKYDVYIVSAAMEFPQSLAEKYEWLQEHFPFITWQQIAFTGSKKLIKGDYMIDDHLKNLDFFDGERLLFTSAHNALVTGYTRVNDWQEVADLLLPVAEPKKADTKMSVA